jgi:hypothetical protein
MSKDMQVWPRRHREFRGRPVRARYEDYGRMIGLCTVREHIAN